MKPTPDLVLNHAFAKVAMEMGPALPAGYGQGSATLTGVLLLMVSQEFNRAADIRAKENAAMTTSFAAGPSLSRVPAVMRRAILRFSSPWLRPKSLRSHTPCSLTASFFWLARRRTWMLCCLLPVK